MNNSAKISSYILSSTYIYYTKKYIIGKLEERKEITERISERNDLILIDNITYRDSMILNLYSYRIFHYLYIWEIIYLDVRLKKNTRVQILLLAVREISSSVNGVRFLYFWENSRVIKYKRPRDSYHRAPVHVADSRVACPPPLMES